MNPLSPAILERYRIRSRRRLRPGLVGGHLTRRKGQSLEFREYLPYSPGDDIRHVDWRASARHGTKRDLLVRSFTAEEQLTLVISVDTRSTLSLPEALPKLQVARWTAQALATVALRSGDRVALHRLFGPASPAAVSLAGTASADRIRPALSVVADAQPSHAPVHLRPLERLLPPAGVWVILTDVYFRQGPSLERLSRKIAAAQDGLRWVILIDLDSWPHERSLLGAGAHRLEGPEPEPEPPRVDLDESALRQVRERIESHKDRFREKLLRTGLDWVHWPWPAAREFDPAAFFRRTFLDDPTLERLFMRER